MRDPITSAANSTVKAIRSLMRSRKERHRERMVVLEGLRLVEEALAHGQVQALLFVPEQLEVTERGLAMLGACRAHPHGHPTTAALLGELSDVETPQGVIALSSMPELELPDAGGLWLVLDGIQDPGNIGTLVRSAAAAGADGVIGLPGSVDFWSPKVLRAGMGAHFRLPLRMASLAEAQTLTGAVPWYGAALGAAQDYDAVDWRAPAALVVGNEGQGISPEVLAATTPIAIPMARAVESLNAAIAGSVILFEAARQRRG